ncbi:MAG TPA: acyltransferase family protein [Acidimicrobiia bacterium]|jgi:peptidoglycan/LPS O-acetylase OafA/YrhL/lysophospholipase L1-like esterase
MAGVAAPERVAPEHAPARLGYIPALDGLRALAVVAVLLYHADQSWIPGGFLGVDVFFVISGYLITCLLLSDFQQTDGIGLKRFWYRRARRLLPALFAMLFVVSLYAIFFLPDVLDQLRGEVISALLYVENWFLVFRNLSYFQSAGRPPLLQHVWSLAVEEQYYLFWPLILMLVLTVWGKSRKALLIGVLAGVAISTLEMAILYHPYTDPSRVYYGTDTRVAALLLGSALAFVWAPWRLIGRTGRNAGILLDIVAVGAGIALFYMFLNVHDFDTSLYRGGFLLVAIVSTVLIAATVHPASKLVPWLLGFSVLRWIGVRSYGIYLWHWPIYMVTRPHSDVPLTGIPLLVLRLTLTFLAAAASYRYIEEPIRHGAIERQWAHYKTASADTQRKVMTRFTLGAAGLVVGLVIIVVGLGNGGSVAAPAGFGKQTHVVIGPGASTTTVAGQVTTTLAPDATTTTLAPGASPPAVTAIGDSVMLGAANQLIGAIDPLLGTLVVPQVTTVDAAESRQFSAGVAEIEARKNAGTLGQIVIVQLGTNGLIDPADFDHMMQLLADRQKVVLINAKVPRAWEQQVNDTLAAGAAKYKKNTVLLDWHGYGGAHPEFFYDDGIHLRPEGAVAYADFVAKALTASGSP